MFHRRRAYFALALLLLTILILAHPQSCYAAAANALSIWWEVVLPALLPFFLASNLLSRLGMIQFLGVFLEPVTRHLFNLPGSAALVIALGFTSGPPVAATMVADLRRQNLCSQKEGERLLCFTHNASPLFMLGVIPVGMLGNPAFGPPLAATHYLANLTLGFAWRWYGRKEPPAAYPQHGGCWQRATSVMQRVLDKENRPLGSLMAEAIMQSCQTLALVGGYMMMAAVALALLKELHLMSLIIHVLAIPLQLFSLSPTLSEALVNGLMEITLGTQMACTTAAPIMDRLTVTSILLGWSGLAIHGQVASALSNTDIRLAPFILSRLAHGILAAIYLPFLLPASLPVLLPLPTFTQPAWIDILAASTKSLGLSITACLVVALIYKAFRRF